MPATSSLPPGRVDLDAAQLDHRGSHRGLGDPGASKNGPDPGHQLAGGEGLGDVVVGTELEAQDPIHLVVPGTEDQHRGGPAARRSAPRLAVRGGLTVAKPTTDVEPVEIPRQPDVHHDQLGVLPLHERQPSLPVVRLQDSESIAAQVHGHQVGDVMVILDHHQGLFAGHHTTSLPPGRVPRRSWLGKCELLGGVGRTGSRPARPGQPITAERSSRRQTTRSPDQVSSMAQTLLSTRLGAGPPPV